jgi:phage repressor protein C with HTH and peptisase S24 domain
MVAYLTDCMIDYKAAMIEYRTQHNLSQADMAEKLGMSQQVYSNIESGKKKKIDADFVVKYKEATAINLWDLQDSVVSDPTTPYINQRRKAKQTNTPFMAPFFPVKAQAGYVKAVDQEKYMDTLEHFALPPGITPHGQRWAYWEIEGNSMEPVFRSGDIILASQVHPMDWDQLRNFYTYVIVTKDETGQEGVLIKRIFCKNQLEWVLISENESEYPQQLLPVEYIREVWVYRKTIKTDAAPTKQFEIKV